MGEECNLEDQNESNVPYLEVQARQHKNCHRAEGWSSSSPDTDLKDGRFDSIALGLIREEGQSGFLPFPSLMDESVTSCHNAAISDNSLLMATRLIPHLVISAVD